QVSLETRGKNIANPSHLHLAGVTTRLTAVTGLSPNALRPLVATALPIVAGIVAVILLVLITRPQALLDPINVPLFAAITVGALLSVRKEPRRGFLTLVNPPLVAAYARIGATALPGLALAIV